MPTVKNDCNKYKLRLYLQYCNINSKNDGCSNRKKLWLPVSIYSIDGIELLQLSLFSVVTIEFSINMGLGLHLIFSVQKKFKNVYWYKYKLHFKTNFTLEFHIKQMMTILNFVLQILDLAYTRAYKIPSNFF